MYNEIKTNLATKIDKTLVDDLLNDYNEIKNYHFLDKHESAINKSGKFVETVFQILKYILSNKVIAASTISINNISKELEQTPKGQLPDSIRITIPRSANAIYTIRSRRGAAHKSDYISPNNIDCEFVVSTCDWILAEFLRLYHNSDIKEITRIVNSIVEKKVPLIEEFDDGLVILLNDLSIMNQILIILYHYYPEYINTKDLKKILKCKYSQQITSNLRNAEKQRLIYRNGKENIITKLGKQTVNDIIYKRERND